MHFLQRIVESVRAFSDKVAIAADLVNQHYGDLFKSAYHIAQQFLIYSHRKNKVCLVIAKKSVPLYQTLLACFLSDLIYMPINVHASRNRNKKIIQLANPDFICIGDCQFDILCHLLCVLENKIVFVLNQQLYELLLQTALPHHFVLISADDSVEISLDTIILPSKDDICYLFFTSGSTGSPKGIPITYQNISSYLNSIFTLFRFNQADRVIQVSDIAFDLSLHEILTTWSVGATLYIYDDSVSTYLSNFIYINKITHGFFVPSSIPVMVKQCEYFHLTLSSLKKIFLCGEIFPLSYARMLESIAPCSMIVNLYGPTETTIACTYHFYRKNEDYGSLQSVPIGFAFPTVSLSLSKENELIIEGVQVFKGYWPLKSKEAYIDSYHTGDFVFFDTRWGYVFQTRKDDQWQIQGYRIEKNEVEYALRSVLHLDEIYVIPLRHESNLTQKLLAFSTRALDITQYKKQLSSFIPSSAIPECCIQLDSIPRLSNGKVDYKALSQGGICV